MSRKNNTLRWAFCGGAVLAVASWSGATSASASAQETDVATIPSRALVSQPNDDERTKSDAEKDAEKDEKREYPWEQSWLRPIAPLKNAEDDAKRSYFGVSGVVPPALWPNAWPEAFDATNGFERLADFEGRFDLARGDYDAAIETARRNLSELAPWNEPKRRYAAVNDPDGDGFVYVGQSGRSAQPSTAYRDNLLGLATAFELKGDYDEALAVYEALYGAESVEILWAKARVAYRQGNEGEAFLLVMEAVEVETKRGLPFEAYCKGIESGALSRKTAGSRRDLEALEDATGVYYVERNIWDRLPPEVANSVNAVPPAYEWLEVERFRVNCARVLCPELPIAVVEASRLEALTEYAELRRDALTRFLAFIDRTFEATPENGWHRGGKKAGFQGRVELLHRVAEAP